MAIEPEGGASATPHEEEKFERLVFGWQFQQVDNRGNFESFWFKEAPTLEIYNGYVHVRGGHKDGHRSVDAKLDGFPFSRLKPVVEWAQTVGEPPGERTGITVEDIHKSMGG